MTDAHNHNIHIYTRPHTESYPKQQAVSFQMLGFDATAAYVLYTTHIYPKNHVAL